MSCAKKKKKRQQKKKTTKKTPPTLVMCVIEKNIPLLCDNAVIVINLCWCSRFRVLNSTLWSGQNHIITQRSVKMSCTFYYLVQILTCTKTLYE